MPYSFGFAATGKERIMNRKFMKITGVIAAVSMITTVPAVNAATLGGVYNYTGTENSPSGNNNSAIAEYLDTEYWTIPDSGIRGLMTKQDTKALDGTTNDGNFGKCFTGAGNYYTFSPNKSNADIIYYTFDFMGSNSRGNFAINGHRLDASRYTASNTTYTGINLCSTNYRAYHPYRITVIADKLNKKAYYYSIENDGEEITTETTGLTLTTEADQLVLGNRYNNNNNRYFFKNFEYGTLGYEISGADTITVGTSENYTVSETGTADDKVSFIPENLELTVDAEGVTVIDGVVTVDAEGVKVQNGVVTVSESVANNTVIKLQAKINGSVIAEKDVTVLNPLPDESEIEEATLYAESETEVGFTAEFTAKNAVTGLTWYLKKSGGEYTELPVPGKLPEISAGSTIKIGLVVSGFEDLVSSGSELSAGYVVE